MPEKPQPHLTAWDGVRLAMDDSSAMLARHTPELHDKAADLHAALAMLDGTRLESEPRADRIDARLTEVMALRARLAARLSQPEYAATALAPADGRSWMLRELVLNDRVRFSIVLDGAAGDPVTAALAAGRMVNPLVDLMLDIVRPGDRVLDLGAHVGMFTLAAAAAGCEVLAIEASPSNAALLRSSVWQNGFHDVYVVNVAASDNSTSTVEFLSRGPWGHVAWEGGQVAWDDVGERDSVHVPAVRIEQLASELNWATLAFIKMDIEGSELRALAGLHGLLSSPEAPALLFESNGHTLALAGSTPQQLLAEVEAFGYSVYLVEQGCLTRVTSADLQVQTVVDYLAIKRRPPGLGGWTVVPSMTEDDTVRRLLSDCLQPNAHCRIYVGRAMAEFGAGLLRRPEVVSALDALARDPVEAVRDAVRWWSAAAARATDSQDVATCQ